jgi:uncharacterized protein with von Willebrand factor type A (vWA) domain
MSVLRHIQFCGDLVRALANEMRFRYYRAAYRHCGETHPDAWLIARRMTHAQLAVTDFLRKYTN